MSMSCSVSRPSMPPGAAGDAEAGLVTAVAVTVGADADM